MILDLAKLTSDSETISGVEVVKFRDSMDTEHRVECRVRLQIGKVAETYHVDGDVVGRFTTECHRCLEETNVEVRSSFEVVVQRLARGQDAESSDEDFISLPFGQNELSLDQQIYESVIVGIPIQIFCREDCKGLCTRCGTNLNKDKCNCASEADPRWDALKSLKKILPE